jgi:phage portal protein BeeE
MAAREIALAMGVPPLLLGLPGDNTYSNYAEANRTFWRQTVIPLGFLWSQATPLSRSRPTAPVVGHVPR